MRRTALRAGERPRQTHRPADRNRISLKISLTQRYLEYTWLGNTWQGASLPRFAEFLRLVPSNRQPAAHAPPRGHVRYYSERLPFHFHVVFSPSVLQFIPLVAHVKLYILYIDE